MTTLTEFLFPAPARRSVAGIIRWWEERRLPYNLIVGATGLASLITVTAIANLPPDPHGTPPLAVAVVFGIAANICYTIGPVAEILIEKLSGGRVLPTGPTLYRMGLTFSIGLTLLPTLIITWDWVIRMLNAVL